MRRLLRGCCSADCLDWLGAHGGWSASCGFRCWVSFTLYECLFLLIFQFRFSCDHPVPLGNRSSKGPRCHRIRIPVLYHHRYLDRQLCHLFYPEQDGYWFLPNPSRYPILVGTHPRYWTLPLAGIAPMVCQEGSSRCCVSGPRKNQRSPSQLRLCPA